MRTFLLVLHLASAAVWFGHKLTIPADIRRSLAAAGEHEEAMVGRVGAVAPLGIGSALATFATGTGLLAWNGWRATTLVGVGIMAAVGAVAVGATSARRAWGGLESAVAEEDAPLASAFGRRFSRSLVAENALWLGALSAMVAG